MLDFSKKFCFTKLPAKAEPAARRGRKATGLFKDEQIAGLPGAGNHGFFIFELNWSPIISDYIFRTGGGIGNEKEIFRFQTSSWRDWFNCFSGLHAVNSDAWL